MPLLEGIGYSGDRNVVILDIGAAYTKCGIAGESCPRCVIPSQVKEEKTGQVRKVWQYNTETELFENLKDFLFGLYFRHLLVNPKDRRVVVCESLLCPAVFRNTLAKVLFKHFEVGSVLFAPGHLVSLLTLGITTGLVMDVGYNETLVVPIYEDIPVLKALQSIPRAGKAVHDRIRNMLLETGKLTMEKEEDIPVSSKPEYLTDEVLEDIKVRCCFTTNLSRAKKIHSVTVYGKDENKAIVVCKFVLSASKFKLPRPPPSLQYPLDGSTALNVDGKVREHACEVMFEQDNEEQSIVTLLLDAILQCPIDMRKQLSRNIVIIGGTSMMPGFLHRVRQELYEVSKQPRYNSLAVRKFLFYQTPAKANYTAWLGGALFGALETLPSRSISREAYLETGTLPDWCCITS